MVLGKNAFDRWRSFAQVRSNEHFDAPFPIYDDGWRDLGEHELWFVHAGLYDQTTHIPLIVRVPGALDGDSACPLPDDFLSTGYSTPRACRCDASASVLNCDG